MKYILCRHILAAVHFNSNLQRETKLHKETNQSRIAISYPKFKNGEAVVRDIRIKPNFGRLNCTLCGCKFSVKPCWLICHPDLKYYIKYFCVSALYSTINLGKYRSNPPKGFNFVICVMCY